MDTFSELRQLAGDMTELGDTATATLVRQAIDRFSAWKFERASDY
jgi:hypothetical protein